MNKQGGSIHANLSLVVVNESEGRIVQSVEYWSSAPADASGAA